MKRFWEEKTLQELSHEEWESLCDGCGKCCLYKLEDEDSGEIYFTCVACKLLDTQNGGCRDYPGRLQQVPDCIQLRQVDIGSINWLPSTCSYRLVSEGKALPSWHHLVSGDPAAVHEAGASVVGKVYDEEQVELDELQDYIVHWVD